MKTTFRLIGCVLVIAIAVTIGFSQSQKYQWPAGPACGVKCGSERWIVKALADLDATKVNFTPEVATFAQVRGFERPADTPIDARIDPVEMKTYSLKATLVEYKLETDHDFHIVIADPQDPKKTIIAEIVDPACSRVCQSKKLDVLKAVREKFVAQMGEPTSSFHKSGISITITGVGFFDFLHGQTGVAPNGFELHPVLDVAFEK